MPHRAKYKEVFNRYKTERAAYMLELSSKGKRQAERLVGTAFEHGGHVAPLKPAQVMTPSSHPIASHPIPSHPIPSDLIPSQMTAPPKPAQAVPSSSPPTHAAVSRADGASAVCGPGARRGRQGPAGRARLGPGPGSAPPLTHLIPDLLR